MRGSNGRKPVDVVPLTLPAANAEVKRLHRHHGPIPGGFAWFAVGAIVDGMLVGAAIAGRPTNRNNDDRQTCEVLRVAVDGTPNACSALLAACAKAAQAIGCRRIITYTLTTESGASVRGAGWVCTSENTGPSWWTHEGTRTPAKRREHMSVPKTRWEKMFKPAVTYISMPIDDVETEQAGLFGGDR